jgi:hypothetical protein
MSREKKEQKKVSRLSAQDIKDILNTIEIGFKKMSDAEKKATLLELGFDKNNIEGYTDTQMLDKVKKSYDNILPAIDLDNVKIDAKYKNASEFISKAKPKELKEKIETYNRL